MAVRYDPVLIAGIVEEIRSRWIGRRVEALHLERERREAWIRLGVGGDGTGAIGFLLHPACGFILESGAPPVREGTARRIDFRRLFLADVRSPGDERQLVFDLAGGPRDARPDRPAVYRLIVELHTNQWNAVLTRGVDDRIEAVLWPRTAGGRPLQPGARYVGPEGARAWADQPPDVTEWESLLESIPPPRRRETLLHSMASTSSLNVDWILGEAAVEGSPDDALRASHERYVRLRTGSAGEAWLLQRGAALQPYPAALGSAARRCGSLLEAMSVAAAESAAWPPPDSESQAGTVARPRSTPEAERLERALRRRVRDLKKRRAALERQLEGESADHLRQIGNLLLARKQEVPRGSEHVCLPGFDGRDVEVTLDPRLDVVRNADRFYDHARRRERAARAIPGRLKRTNERIARLEDAREALASSGATEALWELVGGRPEGAESPRPGRSPTEPLPYRRFRSSGGHEIRVGRSSRGNDALTFGHSAPDDIWLHARQVAGAHVILRWEKRDQNPPRADLTEAAVLAALHSEARHSGMVAVDWTRRKYVRKPRKAAPGAVVPERVATLFVEPDPAVAERLSPDE